MPGRFWFNTCVPNTIEVEKIGVFDPDYGDPDFRLAALIGEIRSLYEKRLASEGWLEHADEAIRIDFFRHGGRVENRMAKRSAAGIVHGDRK